jgi:hypothetical protein
MGYQMGTLGLSERLPASALANIHLGFVTPAVDQALPLSY